MRYVVAFLALLLSLSPAFAEGGAAAASESFSDSQKTAIEEIVKTYLTKEHPEILMQAMQELQKRDQASAEAKTQDAIKAKHDQIYSDANTPVGGNPKGDVTIVEFFDDQCGYCKMSEPFLEKILNEDKNVRFIYKEFPVLGPASTTAAKASLAAFRQGNDKFIAFHNALLAKKEHLNDDIIYQTAKDVGLDVDKLKADANDDATAKQIQANLDLGTDIGVRGTPMFIIGSKVFPGALQEDQLKKAITDARATAKKG